MQASEKLIHLLYVPTIYCNLGCTYCYLGRQTDENMLGKDFDRALSTLDFAVEKFKASAITPYNISLHGGEVTTLPGHVLNDLFQYIQNYYSENKALLERHNFTKTNPHIKTNLYNFDKHYDLMHEHEVSISASVDLPLSLHEKYRVTKKGNSTLERTLNNVSLLGKYPYRKKMSAVLYEEHLTKVDEIIADIWRLHKETGIDMNRFNFMFGFESENNTEKFIAVDNLDTKAVNGERQVAFYERLKEEFSGTELEEGFRKHWFDEFTPNYCTNALNCGEKFFLLQSDGEIYSCVRGQGAEVFHYGNIFEDSIEIIMARAERKISQVHRTKGLHKDCQRCEYLALCRTGCAYVKNEQNSAKSYTCALQKAIYRDNPDIYPATPPVDIEKARNEYVVEMHPQLIATSLQPKRNTLVLPNDLYDAGNSLDELIVQDEKLQALYSPEYIKIAINGEVENLASQILKVTRPIYTLSKHDSVEIYIHKSMLESACNDPVRNTLYLQFLRDTSVIYGDEQRTKQEHTYTFEVFANMLSKDETINSRYLKYELTPLLHTLKGSYLPNVLNNLFITTGYLRKYHYEKQKANAFYHIQAINLPFHNVEFYWA